MLMSVLRLFRHTVLDSLNCIVRSWIQDVSIKKVVVIFVTDDDFLTRMHVYLGVVGGMLWF